MVQNPPGRFSPLYKFHSWVGLVRLYVRLQLCCISMESFPSLQCPFVCHPQGPSFSVLTQSHVRKTLSAILTSLHIDPSTHPFHAFRRSGASLAFNSDLSLQSIQHQCTWSSDAVWKYIITNPYHQSCVSPTFKKLPRQQ